MTRPGIEPRSPAPLANTITVGSIKILEIVWQPWIYTKDNRILSFLVERYNIKTDIISYYLLLNAITLKLCRKNKIAQI